MHQSLPRGGWENSLDHCVYLRSAVICISLSTILSLYQEKNHWAISVIMYMLLSGGGQG